MTKISLEKMEERLLNEHNHGTSRSGSRTGIEKARLERET